jgi:hypothetical protein
MLTWIPTGLPAFLLPNRLGCQYFFIITACLCRAVCLPVSLPAFLPGYIYFCMTACMAACLPTCMLSACSLPFIRLYAYMPIYLSAGLNAFFCLHLCLQVCLSSSGDLDENKESIVYSPPPHYRILCSKQIAYATLAFCHSRP